MLQWIAFLAVVCALSVALNRRFERVLAPALCGLMLLLYVLRFLMRLRKERAGRQ